MDSDLATYAQAMTHALHPDFFRFDPVLSNEFARCRYQQSGKACRNPAMPGDNVAVAFPGRRFGHLHFYCGCGTYWGAGSKARPFPPCFPCYAGITIWIEFGTFWGIKSFRSIPRVYFAAIFPLLLLFAWQR